MFGWGRAQIVSCSLVLLTVPAVAAPPADPHAKAPPGFNVHLVDQKGSNRFWRGGAPRKDTVEALAASARERHVTITFVDLRTPPNGDDRSGKQGRLSPTDESAAAAKLGQHYLSISALDKNLPERLQSALRQGDVYMHCMYGVNRTGFATARYARSTGTTPDRAGLGKHDWKQGDAFQQHRAR